MNAFRLYFYFTKKKKISMNLQNNLCLLCLLFFTEGKWIYLTPRPPSWKVCLPFSHPQDKLRMLKPFTHNKTVIKQVTRPHINQLFQRRGPNLHSLSSLLVGGGIFFQVLFRVLEFFWSGSTFFQQMFHFSDSFCDHQKKEKKNPESHYRNLNF